MDQDQPAARKWPTGSPTRRSRRGRRETTTLVTAGRTSRLGVPATWARPSSTAADLSGAPAIRLLPRTATALWLTSLDYDGAVPCHDPAGAPFFHLTSRRRQLLRPTPLPSHSHARVGVVKWAVTVFRPGTVRKEDRTPPVPAASSGSWINEESCPLFGHGGQGKDRSS
jgi:hypothetical protein